MADFSQSIKEQMNDPSSGMVPSNVSRKTVADGSWLQKYTFGKLSARDNFLADQIDVNVSAISADINIVDGKVETVSSDLNVVSSKLENLSPLIYKGNTTVQCAMDMTATVINGEVYSLTDSGYFYPNTENEFKVKIGDEIAWTSGDPTQSLEARWFPIGQDIHVEYSALQDAFIDVNNENYTIGITGCRPIIFNPPLVKTYIDEPDNEHYEIGIDIDEITAGRVKVIEATASPSKPITFYEPYTSGICYNPNIVEAGDGISATNITATTASGQSAKFTDISATNITGNLSGLAASAKSAQFIHGISNWTDNVDRAVTFVSANSTYSDVGTDSASFTFNPGTDTLKVKNINIAGNLTTSASQPKINLLYTGALTDEISYSSTNPKLYFSGKNGINIAEGALVFAYHNIPRRFGTQLQSYSGVGGWFGFSMKDGNDDKVGVVADLYSATSAISLTATGNSAKFTNISATNITSLTSIGNSAKFTNISSTNITALTATGNSAKFTSISSTNITASTATISTATGASAKFTNISATNITALSATGNSAKFTDFNGTRINNKNISNLVSGNGITGIMTATSIGTNASILYLI